MFLFLNTIFILFAYLINFFIYIYVFNFYFYGFGSVEIQKRFNSGIRSVYQKRFCHDILNICAFSGGSIFKWSGSSGLNVNPWINLFILGSSNWFYNSHPWCQVPTGSILIWYFAQRRCSTLKSLVFFLCSIFPLENRA